MSEFYRGFLFGGGCGAAAMLIVIVFWLASFLPNARRRRG